MVDDSLSVVLVRHGETLGLALGDQVSREIVAAGDDELTEEGRRQARRLSADPEFISLASTFDVVLCSPLSRALETAVLALNTHELAEARRSVGAKSALRIIVDPRLREINRNQRRNEGKKLAWRHKGKLKGDLTALPFLQQLPYLEMDFGLVGDSIWWDADADGRCTVDYHDAHWRAHAYVADLLKMGSTWQRICLIGHEGMFRSFAGIISIPHPPSWLPCTIRRICTVKPASNQQKNWKSPILAKCVRSHLCEELHKSDIREALLILGCSDDNEARRRVFHAAELLRQAKHPLPVVWVGATNEMDCFLALATRFFSQEEQELIHADQCSVTTECNIDHGLAVLAALRPEVSQEGWSLLSEDEQLAVCDADGDIGAESAGLVFHDVQAAQAEAEIRGSCAVNERTRKNKFIVRRVGPQPGCSDPLLRKGVLRNYGGGPWRVHARRPWNVRVVTNSWHIPRTLFIFSGTPHCHGGFVLTSAGFEYTEGDSEITPNHRCYGTIFAGMLLNEAHELMFWKIWRSMSKELLAQALNMLDHGNMILRDHPKCSKEAARILKELKQIHSRGASRSEFFNLLRNSHKQAIPAALIPLGPHASLALHYAAEWGLLGLCRDLLFCWGSPLNSRNARGQLPRDLAHGETLQFLDAVANAFALDLQ